MRTVNTANLNFPIKPDYASRKTFREIAEIIGVKYDRLGLNAGSLPFAPADATAGSESELQTVVTGNKNNVDLPLMIGQSNYFANTKRRAKSGDTSQKVMTDLERHLNNNTEGVWENSWVRFPRDKMGLFAQATVQQDLMADKANIYAGQRSDIGRFIFDEAGTGYIRVPISYLLKLSLAEIVAPGRNGHTPLHRTGLRIMENFQNDNTSPETSSFYVVSPKSDHGPGCAVAREMAVRFLLTQLLVEYANSRGKTKNISYASQMEGVEMVTVQALTAVICTLAGVLGFYLFLKGQSAMALVLTLFATQSWRFVSEFLRADYRGNNRFSAYQLMSLGAITYLLALVLGFSGDVRPIAPQLTAGLQVMWHPGLILFLVALWIVSFLYTGKSQVTACTIDIRVMENKI